MPMLHVQKCSTCSPASRGSEDELLPPRDAPVFACHQRSPGPSQQQLQKQQGEKRVQEQGESWKHVRDIRKQGGPLDAREGNSPLAEETGGVQFLRIPPALQSKVFPTSQKLLQPRFVSSVPIKRQTSVWASLPVGTFGDSICICFSHRGQELWPHVTPPPLLDRTTSFSVSKPLWKRSLIHVSRQQPVFCIFGVESCLSFHVPGLE